MVSPTMGPVKRYIRCSVAARSGEFR